MKSTPLNANEIQHDNEKLGGMKIRPKCENENYLSTQSFTGKNVVVTAAEYGVGEAVASHSQKKVQTLYWSIIKLRICLF